MIKRLLFIPLFLCLVLFTSAYPQKRYALLIGVDYEGSLALDYTRQDAIQLGNILKYEFGYTIKVLTKQHETTKSAIIKAFSDLKDKGNYYDQIIVFFSGHGQRDKGSTEVGYLLPTDVNTNDLFVSAIDMSIIQNLSKTLNSKQVLFILDCCYSGIIGSYANMDVSGGDKTLRSRQVITAGRSGQKARMYEAKQLSLYTYYLTRGLSRAGNFLRADSDKDGELTVWDLQTYVQKKVSDETGKRQTPRMYNYTEDDGIFLFRNRNYQMPPTRASNDLGKEKRSETTNPVRKPAYAPPPLRNNSMRLNEDNVKAMLKEKSLFDSYRNNTVNGFENDFVLQNDGQVVYDRNSGLMWQQSGSSKGMGYPIAKTYIEQLNLAGYSDWRFPTLEEAMSLVERRKNKDGLYINSVFDSHQTLIWTSDMTSWSSSSILGNDKEFGVPWVVNFLNGRCSFDVFIYNFPYVRAVRSVQ